MNTLAKRAMTIVTGICMMAGAAWVAVTLLASFGLLPIP